MASLLPPYILSVPHFVLYYPLMKSTYSAASTGFETHAAFRNKGMAAAANQAVDIGITTDEEMIEAE